MHNIDKLKSEVDLIQQLLDDLKKSTLSDLEKQKKETEIKEKAEQTKKNIQAEIDALKDKTDADSLSKKAEAETLLNSFTETLNLKLEISNNSQEVSDNVPQNNTTDWWDIEQKDFSSIESSSENSETEKEKKWFFGRTTDWIGDQWSNVWNKETRKKEAGLNTLRTAWFVATWVWAAALLWKWIKWIGNLFRKNKKKEDKENKPEEQKQGSWFWNRPFWKFVKGLGAWLWILSGVYYVAHGIYTKNWRLRDIFDWEPWKKLEFDAALEYCKWAIANQDNKEGMAYWMDLKYHEDTWEIEAYWERIKIDKNNRKIIWVWIGDVNFKKYEHMINAAIVIAFLKKNYSWRCANNSPFDLSWSRRWNINVNTNEGSEIALDGSGRWGKIIWISAAGIASVATAIWWWWLKTWATVLSIWWILWLAGWAAYDRDNIMHNLMPELDNDNWKKNLAAYLNSMGCWQMRNQAKENITDSPIKDPVWEFLEEIQKEREKQNLPAEWWRLKFDAIPDLNDKNRYTIKAYGREINAEITWSKWQEEMRLLWISWWVPAIKVDVSKWNISNLKVPLKEWLYMTAVLGELLEKYHHKCVGYPYFHIKKFINSRWLYVNDRKSLNIVLTDTLAYSNKYLQKNMPTIFKNKEKEFLEFLNDWITDEHNVSIWKKH